MTGAEVQTLWPQERDVVPMTPAARIDQTTTDHNEVRGTGELPFRRGRPRRLTAAHFAPVPLHPRKTFLELVAAIAADLTEPLKRRS